MLPRAFAEVLLPRGIHSRAPAHRLFHAVPDVGLDARSRRLSADGLEHPSTERADCVRASQPEAVLLSAPSQEDRAGLIQLCRLQTADCGARLPACMPRTASKASDVMGFLTHRDSTTSDLYLYATRYDVMYLVLPFPRLKSYLVSVALCGGIIHTGAPWLYTGPG